VITPGKRRADIARGSFVLSNTEAKAEIIGACNKHEQELPTFLSKTLKARGHLGNYLCYC